MAIIRDTKLHVWIQKNDTLIEHLRVDYEQATGNTMEFDKWVEHFYHQSKANDQALPTTEELTYMVWLADNRTLLNKAVTLQETTISSEDIRSLNYNYYRKTEQGKIPLSQFIS
jgi:hypothetical protein